MSTIPGDDSRIGLLYERDGPLCTAANDSKLPSVACRIVFTTFPTGFKSDDENRISKTPPPSALCANLTTRVDCGNNQEPYKCYNNDCCFAPVSPNPHNLPWCFHPKGWKGPVPPPPPPPPPSQPPSPPPVAGQCSNATTGRHDCRCSKAKAPLATAGALIRTPGHNRMRARARKAAAIYP